MRPAEEGGIFVETTLVERLVGDAANESGILPFVQETLVLLWEKVERRFLPLRAYEALILSASSYKALGTGYLAGLQVAMARRADSAFWNLSLDQQAIARRVFLRLVQFGDGRADTRRQLALAELCCTDEVPELVEDTVTELAEQRPLTLGGAQGSPRRTVDLAHEALIEGWPMLKGWIVERREALLVRRRLEAKATEWERLGRGKGGLLDTVELKETEHWLASPDAADTGYRKSLQSLADASRAADQKRLWLRVGTVTSVVLLVITAVAIYALLQRNAAVREAALRRQVEVQLATARARQVAAIARNRLESGDAEQALLLGIAATQQITDTTEVADLLRDSLHAWRGEAVLLGHEDRVSRVVFSPNGQYLASISDDNTARVWQIAGERLVLLLRGQMAELTDVAFSPDSRLVATTSRDGTTRIWAVSTGQALLILKQSGQVVSLQMDHEGKALATGSESGDV